MLGRITQEDLLLHLLRVLLVGHRLYVCFVMFLLLHFAQLVLAVSESAAHAVLALSGRCHVPTHFGLVVVLLLLDADHHLGLWLHGLESLDFYLDVLRHSYQFLVNRNQHVGVESSVVKLELAQRPLLPVGEGVNLAQLSLEDIQRHIGQRCRLRILEHAVE